MIGPTTRRFEVITGDVRRRYWSDEEKAAIVAESATPTTSISAVARRYGLHPNQLFAWRRQFRADEGCRGNGGFIPVVVSDGPKPPMPAAVEAGAIDILVGGLTVRIAGPVDVTALRDVLVVARQLP